MINAQAKEFLVVVIVLDMKVFWLPWTTDIAQLQLQLKRTIIVLLSS